MWILKIIIIFLNYLFVLFWNYWNEIELLLEKSWIELFKWVVVFEFDNLVNFFFCFIENLFILIK